MSKTSPALYSRSASVNIIHVINAINKTHYEIRDKFNLEQIREERKAVILLINNVIHREEQDYGSSNGEG